jgi:hypothetical protein
MVDQMHFGNARQAVINQSYEILYLIRSLEELAQSAFRPYCSTALSIPRVEELA